ncbi:MAG: DUF4149 domain-containing protein [Rhodoferax sp.]
MARRFAALLAALWWGSLTTIGFLVVPLLFANLPTLAMAGGMAAKLFAAQTWVSMVCGLLLLLLSRSKQSQTLYQWAQVAIIFITLGLLTALLNQFAVAPRIVARENLRLWHSVGSVMYLVQWLCAGTVLWKLASNSPQPD